MEQESSNSPAVPVDAIDLDPEVPVVQTEAEHVEEQVADARQKLQDAYASAAADTDDPHERVELLEAARDASQITADNQTPPATNA